MGRGVAVGVGVGVNVATVVATLVATPVAVVAGGTMVIVGNTVAVGVVSETAVTGLFGVADSG